MSKEAIFIDNDEISYQEKLILKIQSKPNRPKTYHIVTYGCQMNEHDSEKLAGMLEAMGLKGINSRTEADFVLFNTCCIRDNAQRKALGNITWLKQIKKKRPDLLIGVCGCMTQQEGMAEIMEKDYPFVDMVFGTHNMHVFPEIMLTAINSKGKGPVVKIETNQYLIAEGLPVTRENPFRAFVNIIYGCNNYCSYCVVPYVRGRERSRDPKAIVQEVKLLKSQGAKEIMLLGQNVNSYRGGEDGKTSFPELLAMLDQTGIERIRFMTSHPKDLSKELISVMKNSQHVLKQLHLPVQSGSNSILKKMNRQYTVEQYLEKIDSIRQQIPDIGLTTDFIVAFPGETDQDFEDTLELVRRVRFDAAFTFIFSSREGTKAASLSNKIEAKLAKERIGRLIALQEVITREIHESLFGQREQVLVESLSKKDPNRVTGKGERGIAVTFDGSLEDIGKIVNVKMVESTGSTFRGLRMDKIN